MPKAGSARTLIPLFLFLTAPLGRRIFLILRIKFAVSADSDEIRDVATSFPIYGSEISSDVNTPTVLIFSVERMVVQNGSKCVAGKQNETLFRLLSISQS